jgi:hypothetical protein
MRELFTSKLGWRTRGEAMAGITTAEATSVAAQTVEIRNLMSAFSSSGGPPFGEVKLLAENSSLRARTEPQKRWKSRPHKTGAA